MKKVEVFTLVMDYPTSLMGKSEQDELFNQFIYTEEFKFIEKNSISIERVRKLDYDRFETKYVVYAVMDEKIETFWRLKFK